MVSSSQLPFWVTVVGSLGLGSFIGSLVTQYIAIRNQRGYWIADNKKQEWRELIDALREGLRVMALGYDVEMPHHVSRPEDAYSNAEATRKAEVIIRDRIFISPKLVESGLFDQWVALVKEHDEADVSFKERPRTLRSFISNAHKFQNDLIRVAREDLGIGN
jgi:hypothetical protein